MLTPPSDLLSTQRAKSVRQRRDAPPPGGGASRARESGGKDRVADREGKSLPNRPKPAAVTDHTVAKWHTCQDYEKFRRQTPKGAQTPGLLLALVVRARIIGCAEGRQPLVRRGISCRPLVACHAREQMGTRCACRRAARGASEYLFERRLWSGLGAGRDVITLQTCTMPDFENRLVVRADRV